MCYSAMVEQDLKRLGLAFQARVQLDLFEELFRRRLNDSRVRIPRALEAQFAEPEDAVAKRIWAHIAKYRENQAHEYLCELEKQRARLSAAERRLALRSSKAALEERRRAEGRVAWYSERVDALWRKTSTAEDARIFPFWYAPVVVEEQGERWIMPMRFHCRGRGRPAECDARYPGLYNARRESLTGYWREQYGVRHAVVVIRRFYENVPKHRFEHRALAPGEREENVIVAFEPISSEPLSVACLWDRWEASGEPSLLSFAAITDVPPPEVAATGHDRCIVALRDSSARAWLSPSGRTLSELEGVLDERAEERFVPRKVS